MPNTLVDWLMILLFLPIVTCIWINCILELHKRWKEWK